MVQTIEAATVSGGVARYTGVIRARTESNLGFRVGGKIFERLVDPGDRVRLGQPLMRLDRTDFSLALNAARASVEAARAQMIKAKADEERSRKLVGDGWTSKQTYDQNKAAADAAIAQFANAEAQASQIANQAGYSELQADADGVVMEVPVRTRAGGRRRPDRGEAGPRRRPRGGGVPARRQSALGTRRGLGHPLRRGRSHLSGSSCGNCPPPPIRPRAPTGPATSSRAAARPRRWARP